MNVTLLSDSYPPIVDGVANAVVNYAKNLEKMGDSAQVVTPAYPGADYSADPWDVVSFASVDTRKIVGYPAGIPFSPKAMRSVRNFKPDVLHTHCPTASNYLAREIRSRLEVPLITTCHTKYDIDIKNSFHTKWFQDFAIKVLVNNMNACDEIWVVSNGAGENLKKMGYTGEYVVMNNGVDMPRERLSEDEIHKYTKGVQLPDNVPVFLFVGRMMWYKGIRITLDALATLHAKGIDFRMIFIGSGGEDEEVKKYTKQLGIEEKTLFLGHIGDRQELSAWYCRSDLLLFPSTFDTNGLVVREAAARSVASVMVKDSCAAEGVTDNVNGFLIDENAESMCELLLKIKDNRDLMRRVGVNAAEQLYFSWEDSVRAARERYQIVIDRYKSGYRREGMLHNKFFSFAGWLMDGKK